MHNPFHITLHNHTTDYYPYGLPMATSTGATVNRYKYSAKELETREMVSGLRKYMRSYGKLHDSAFSGQ